MQAFSKEAKEDRRKKLNVRPQMLNPALTWMLHPRQRAGIFKGVLVPPPAPRADTLGFAAIDFISNPKKFRVVAV